MLLTVWLWSVKIGWSASTLQIKINLSVEQLANVFSFCQFTSVTGPEYYINSYYSYIVTIYISNKSRLIAQALLFNEQCNVFKKYSTNLKKTKMTMCFTFVSSLKHEATLLKIYTTLIAVLPSLKIVLAGQVQNNIF